MLHVSRRTFLGSTAVVGLVLPVSRITSAVGQNRYMRIQRMVKLPLARLQQFKLQMHAQIIDWKPSFEGYSPVAIFDVPHSIHEYTPITTVTLARPDLLHIATQDYDVPPGEQLVHAFDLYDDEGYLIASESLKASQRLFHCDRLKFTFAIESSFLATDPSRWGRIIKINKDVIRRDDPPYGELSHH